MTCENVTRIAITTLVAGTFFATSACGMSGGAGDVKEGEKTGKVAGQITFRTLQLKPMFTSYVQGVIDSFEKKYPDVKVKWEDVPGDGYNEKIVADAQAGALPDVVNLSTDSFQLLGDRGMLADVAKLDPEVAKDYVPGAWEQFKLPGKGGSVFAYPWYVTPEILTYNKDLFEKAGLDPAKPPTAVEQFFDYAEQIAAKSEGKYSAFMADPKSRLPGDWQKMGVPILNEKQDRFTFDTDKAVAWVERMKDLYAKGAMPKESLLKQDDINQLYGGGKIVFGPGSRASSRTSSRTPRRFTRTRRSRTPSPGRSATSASTPSRSASRRTPSTWTRRPSSPSGSPTAPTRWSSPRTPPSTRPTPPASPTRTSRTRATAGTRRHWPAPSAPSS